MVIRLDLVLSVTILETTKTSSRVAGRHVLFYRSQFWRLQKPDKAVFADEVSFIGHNFGDYKNRFTKIHFPKIVLSVTILETTKTSNGIS